MGARLAFGFVEAQPGDQVEQTEAAMRETFIYVLSGKLDAAVGGERRPVRPGDIIQIPQGVAANIAVGTSAPVRYCAVRSTPALEPAVDQHGASEDKD